MHYWRYISQTILFTIVRYPALRIMSAGQYYRLERLIRTCRRLRLLLLTCWGPRALVCYPKIPREQTVHRCWLQRLRQSGCVHGDCAWLYRSWSRHESNSTLWLSYLEERRNPTHTQSLFHTHSLIYSTHTHTHTVITPPEPHPPTILGIVTKFV